MVKKLSFLSVLLLLGCTTTSGNYQGYLNNKGINLPQTNSFQHCRGYGCKHINNVNLSDAQWNDIKASFIPAPKSAVQEREALRNAIARFERHVGEITGTANDRRGTFKKLGNNQHDCVDESTNTTVYLSLLKQEGLMKFHDVQRPQSRLPLINAGRWPHQTAVIKEQSSETLFAVDSWFHDNGFRPEIVPLEIWKDGWKPKKPLTNPES